MVINHLYITKYSRMQRIGRDMRSRGRNESYFFMRRFDRFFPFLYKDEKISSPDRDAFMEEYLCMNKDAWKNFNRVGIKKIYFRVLELLETTYPE